MMGQAKRDIQPRHNVKKRQTFKIDSYEKAMRILDAISWSRKSYEQLDYMFEEYPDLFDCTHQHISEVMRMHRETVTRAMKKIYEKNMHRKYRKPDQARSDHAV